MPRNQNILAENPVLQGVSSFAQDFGAFVERVNKTRTDYATFTQLNNIGRARVKPNYQSILNKVSAGLGPDEKLTEAAKAEAARQASLPAEAQDVNLVALYDRVTRDRKRAALADAAIMAEQGMAKEAQMATINQNLGLVGMMDKNQQNAIAMGLSNSMDGFSLSGLFDANFGGAGGKKGSGGGDGGGAGHNWQKEWVDNGDGTKTLMMIDPKSGMAIPATTANGEPVVGFGNEKASYDIEGKSAKALIPSSVRNAGPEAIKAWKDNIVATYGRMGYVLSGTDGEGTLFFQARNVGGAGNGKNEVHARQKELLKQARAVKARWESDLGKPDKTGGDTPSVRRANAAAEYNEIQRRLRQLDPANADSYKFIPLPKKK